jgi:hypothetical protein
MIKRTYNFAVGVVLILVSIAFFIMPHFLNLDSFIPVMFSIVSFILAVSFFFMGANQK